MMQFNVIESDTNAKGWNVKISSQDRPCVISKEFLKQLGGIILAAQNEQDLMHLTMWLPTFDGKKGKLSLSGGDLTEMQELQKNYEEQRLFFSEVRQKLQEISELNCLTSICFDGAVIGGGVELLAAFDLRWSTEDSVVWCPQLFNGLCSGFGGERFLRNKFGQALAEYLLFTGEKFLPGDLPPHFYAESDARSMGELEISVNKHLLKYDQVSLDALSWQKKSFARDIEIEQRVLQNQTYENFLKNWVERKPTKTKK